MDEDVVHDAGPPNEDLNIAGPEAELTSIDSLEIIPSDEDMVHVVGTVSDVLTRVELDLACFSEKLVNLNILMMHVATRETDLEDFVSDKDNIGGDSIIKAMEFDLLSGILDSEVRELDNFMSTILSEISDVRKTASSCKNLGQALNEMEDKLHDSEESLIQSLDQVSEIRVHSARFQRILSSFGGEENWKGEKDVDILGTGEFLDQNANIKMQTAEQQRNFLRMLEKSLARELDLEKKVGELKQIEEQMKLRLYSSEQEVFFMEDAAAVIWVRLFEAENAAEVLMGTSKEILGRLQIVQFNLNGSLQHEENLRYELQDSKEKLKAKDCAIQKLEDKLALADSEALTLREKVNSLEKHLQESEIELLNAKSSADAIRAVHSEKLDSLERQLGESDIQLQHALASAEANQEKQSMLYSTIHDMENLIEDLKSRASKAENQAESAEEKCITLSESNADLNEELRFLRSRLGSLEASLHQAEEAKLTTAKDIGIRTKVIANLVMQLAFERERLHKQISSLTKENKILLQQADKDPSLIGSHVGRGNGFSKATCGNESKEASDFSGTGFEEDNAPNVFVAGAELRQADLAFKLETERNIDVRQLKFKYAFMAFIALAISVLAAFLFQNPRGQI
ncbi:hypothetical protein U1Q18_012197 [Sarracenia purpurea var. burkii]